MKKLYFSIACIFLFLLQLKAQSYDPTYTEVIDSVMAPTSKVQIATGILYDRVFPWAGLHVFNSDTSGYQHFRQAYSELYNAAYNKSGMVSDEVVDTIIKAVANTNSAVPIGILYYDFNLIDTNALANGLFYRGSDSLLYDMPNRTGNPYILKTIGIAAALNSAEIPFGTGYIQFRPDYGLFHTNKSVGISSMYADFGNGNQSITFGSPVTAIFSSGGLKTIKFTINFTDNSQVIVYSSITLSSSDAMRFGSPREPDIPPIEIEDTQYGFQGYDESQKSYNKGKYGIYYHRNTPGGPIEQTLKKPIIIVDGFDALDTRDIDKIYGEYLQYTLNGNFGDDMRDKGYDIIVLNFPKGGDYIERNAMLVVTLIKKINAELIQNSSNEQIVVVGPSMGGLVTRYALKWMENNNEPHNTRLWISFDSPHKGANIPIGDQHFLDFFARKAGNKGAKDSRDKIINSPAAKQMLLHHYSSNNNTPAGAPGFRNQWQQTIDNLGFPTTTRNIALINGAINGVTTGNACEEAFNMTVALKYKNFFIKTNIVRVGKAKVSFAGNYGNLCGTFDGWAFLWFITEGRQDAAPSNSKSYDIVPGGTYTAQKDIVDDGQGLSWFFNLGITGLGTYTSFEVNREDHCFIPTKSALALNMNSDLGESLYNRNLVCTGETPFHSYYAPISNEEHITLTTQNVSWITKEIDNIPQPATADYNNIYPIQIQSGSEPICTSTSYQVANLPAGATVDWSAPRTVNIFPPSGNPTTVTKRSNGLFDLRAVINIACVGAPFTLLRTGIQSGPTPSTIDGPYDPIQNTQMGVACTYQNYEFRVSPYDATATYTWTLTPPPGSTEPSYLFSGTNPQMSFTEAGCYTLSVSKTNSCGTVVSQRSICAQECYSGFTIMASPNPASDVMVVTLVDESNDVKALSKTENVTIELFDFTTSAKRKQWHFKNDQKKYNLQLTGLPKGKYVLHVKKGNYKSSKQVIIN